MTAADIFLEQGRGGGVLGYKGGSGKATGQHDGRKEQSDGMKSLFDGKEKGAHGHLLKGAIRSVNSPNSAHQQTGGARHQRGGVVKNRRSGNWSSSGHGPPGNWSSGNIQDGKRHGNWGTMKEVKERSFVFGGNQSSGSPSSNTVTRHDVKISAAQVQSTRVEEKSELMKTLQVSYKESLSGFGLQTRTSSSSAASTERCEREERLRQLEQRVSELEQQFVEEKAGRETLLAIVERVLAGEVVEEKYLELKLVRLIRDTRRKISRFEQIRRGVSPDLNGNGTPEEKLVSKYDKSLHDVSSKAGRHPGKKCSRF